MTLRKKASKTKVTRSSMTTKHTLLMQASGKPETIWSPVAYRFEGLNQDRSGALIM